MSIDFEIQGKKNGGEWITLGTFTKSDDTDFNHLFDDFDDNEFEYNSEYTYRLKETTESSYTNEKDYIWDMNIVIISLPNVDIDTLKHPANPVIIGGRFLDIPKAEAIVAPHKPQPLVLYDRFYDLYIEDTKWEVVSLNIEQGANGIISNISFTVVNKGGSAFNSINYGDNVDIAIYDRHGNRKDLKGLVREKNPNGKWLTVTIKTGDGLLSERKITTESYPEQDIGLTIKTIIEEFYTPIGVNYIDTNTGIERELVTGGKTIDNILTSLNREYNIQYYVDEDWELHLFTYEDLEEAEVKLQYGDN